MPNDGVFYTVKLNIKRIQEEEDFIDDSFNAVIDDIDNKVVGISHLTSGAHWNIWEANTAYVVGDVIRWPAMKSHQYAKCIQAGNTDSVRPTVNVTGSEVTSGTTKWKIVSLTSTSDVNGGAIQIWQGGGSLYERGDAVLYASSLYRCKVASHKSSNNFEADKDNWQEVYASVRPWEDNKFYYENDVVIVGLFLYKCSEDHTSANDFDLPVEKEKWRMVGDVSKVREWEVDTYYMENQLVTIGGILYRSLYTHISDSDSVNNDADFWEPLFASISSWRSNYYYSVGSVVLANNILYRCIEPHVSSSIFSSDYNKWELLHVLPANVYDWDTDTTYTLNQVVKYDGNLYRVISNHISAVDFDPTKFELLTDSINDWISNMDYKVGQYVNYNGSLYKCILDNNDDDFNPANWQKVSGSIDQWESDFDYSVGDIVINANKIYQCNTAHTSSSTFTPDAAKWTEISACITRIPNWEASTDYVVGDLVAHDAKIYRCVTAHTSGNAWNSTEESKWEELSPTINEISNWVVSTDYEVGQLVIYDNKLYRCNTAHTSDSTSFSANISYWDLIGSSGIDVWESNKAYTTSSVVIYNNKIYKCNTAHTSTSTFDDTKWEEISKTKFNDWSANTSYALGDYVVYSNKIYKCTTAHTSISTFDKSKWAEISSYDIDLWQPDTDYSVGNLVIHDNKIYRCNTAHTSDTTSFVVDIANWDEIGSSGIGNWEQNKSYSVDNVVIYDNNIYKCTTAHTSSTTFDQTKWIEVSSSDIDAWSASTSYVVGDFVYKDNQLYRCITAHTSDSYDFYTDVAKWELLDTKWKAENWDASNYYPIGEVVLYSNTPYKCITAHTSLGTFDLDKANWEPLGANIREWVSGITYKVGDIVRYDGELYECTTATNASTFKKSCWNPICKCNISMWSASDDSTIALLHFNNPSNIYANECGDSFTKPSDASSTYSSSNSWHIGDSGYAMYNNSYQGIESSWYNLSSAEDVYTIEWWFYCTDVSGSTAVNFANIQYYDPTYDRGVNLTDYLGSEYYQTIVLRVGGTSVSTMSVNTPYHIAVVLTNTTAKVFVNGTTIGTYTIDAPRFRIYSVSDTNTYGHHYIDELRISNIARYTSDFTPPTEPFSAGNAWGYKKDDLVVYDDKIYRCITANNDDVFTPSKWVEVSPCIGGGIEEWTSGSNYNSGDVIIYNNNLYKVVNDVTSATDTPDNSSDYVKLGGDSIDYATDTDIDNLFN